MAKGNTTADKLIMIDTLERLGVAYHFEQEIEHQLQEIFDFLSEEKDDCDLFTTALQFRLLRQHRLFVPCSMFCCSFSLRLRYMFFSDQSFVAHLLSQPCMTSVLI